MNDVLFSSMSHEWATPRAFFAALDAEFFFTLDPCATPQNATCARFFTAEEDGLKQEWTGSVFMNPPYGHNIGAWLRKAYAASVAGAVVVGLIPAKTETRWWHDFVMRSAEIRLIKGRMRFGESNVNAPFPSAVVIWRPGHHIPVFAVMERILDPKQEPRDGDGA